MNEQNGMLTMNAQTTVVHSKINLNGKKHIENTKRITPLIYIQMSYKTASHHAYVCIHTYIYIVMEM